eukprot:CAMPEP_0198201620 /NCGR_PEP_ID=MMETSP1445-20131203/4555_1 /TAXON_ID=36898 /ORGANISM="Pyramimonas sp., Strain CCMP2087" /LENGTH=348 /DNA_ID=CAMNT_0043872109 /DNA_START=203 /DNA_END=1249 /DNA_ORIENTATION=-
MNHVFPHSHGTSGRWVGLTLVVVLCLLDALCVDSAAVKRDLQFMEERLIGWLGETHHTETPSAMMHRLSQEEKDRGAWVEQLSWRPRAFLFHKFMSEEECDHIVELAKKTVKRSTVVDSETGEVKTDPIRTSSQTFLQRGFDKVTTQVEQRLARYAMIPYENGEDMQVLRYELGQKYDAHHDVGELESKSGQQLAADGGFRAATSLLYLSTVEEGGETVFPYSEWIDPSKATATTYSECGRMGVAAKPVKGDVLLFWSITLDGKIDPASMHAGCPVIRGTKWTGTKWLHQNPFRWTPPPKPGIPAGCEDKHINCPAWAAAGECQKNLGYMVGDLGASNGQCMWSCKKC